MLTDKTTRQTFRRNQAGFTTTQLLITIAVIGIVSTFALIGIDSARASMRLTGSTREFASYLERARSNAIRRNDTSTVQIISQNSYTVTMDFDGDGNVETRTINLQPGVRFPAGHVGIAATFDWRGRVPGQIGFELNSDCCQPSTIHLSGAGDVTIGSEGFQDNEIGEITLNSTPSTEVVGTPSDSPIESPDTPGEGDEPPADGDGDGSPSGDGDGDGSPSGDGDGDGSPPGDGDGDGSPSGDGDGDGGEPTGGAGEGSPPPCVLSAPSTLSLPRNGSPKTFSVVTIVNANNTVITATKTGDISSISPASTMLSGNGTISYTIVYAAGNGRAGTVSVSSLCGNQTIAITFN